MAQKKNTRAKETPARPRRQVNTTQPKVKVTKKGILIFSLSEISPRTGIKKAANKTELLKVRL